MSSNLCDVDSVKGLYWRLIGESLLLLIRLNWWGYFDILTKNITVKVSGCFSVVSLTSLKILFYWLKILKVKTFIFYVFLWSFPFRLYHNPLLLTTPDKRTGSTIRLYLISSVFSNRSGREHEFSFKVLILIPTWFWINYISGVPNEILNN